MKETIQIDLHKAFLPFFSYFNIQFNMQISSPHAMKKTISKRIGSKHFPLFS